MALKPASGKKCGETAKNYSNNKDCKIRTPVHNCTNPCPKGTVSCRRLFVSYCLTTCVCQRIGLIWRQIGEVFQRSTKTQSISARTIYDAIPILSPQYCRERIFPSRITEFCVKFRITVTLRHRDRKTGRYIRGRKQNRLRRLKTRLM